VKGIVRGAALLLFALVSGSEDAEGKIVTVDDDGGADYEKIQEAIDAADGMSFPCESTP